MCATIICGQGKSRCKCVFKETLVLFVTVDGVGALCDLHTVQLKGNVALARYCLARFSKTIHLILDTRRRSLAVYRV